MVETKIWQMTIFQNLILFTNHYGDLQEMLEMASFLKYVDLYLTSEWGRFYMGHPVLLSTFISPDYSAPEFCTKFLWIIYYDNYWTAYRGFSVT
jgi:hypothetical protein